MRLLVAVVVVLGAIIFAPVGGLAEGPATDYRVKLAATVSVAPGERSSVSLTIAARPGYTISRDGPLVITLVVGADAPVALPRTSYRRADAADARAADPRFDLRFRGVAAGTGEISVSAHFWVCTRYTCRPIREELVVAVTVVAATPPGPGDAGTTGAAALSSPAPR